MKKEFKGFVAGAVTASLLFTMVFTAFAEPIEKTIQVAYNNIKLYVDGKLVQPKDANGNRIEPFVYNGTTYLPVRAVSQALEKDVAWDGNTNSVYIGEKPSPVIKEVTVRTAEEFINALGSNKRILLAPGVYDLSGVSQMTPPNSAVTWEQVYDGKELDIRNVSNLTIEGSSTGKTEIRVTPRYAFILNFKDSSNITIKNITAGHTPAEYKCDAGVLGFDGCQDVTVSGSDLYGCGSMGLSIRNTKKLNCDNTVIEYCSLRAVDILQSETIKFTGTKMINHEAYSNIVYAWEGKDITFEACEMTGNNNFGWSFIELCGHSNVLMDKCIIKNNSQPAGTTATWGDAYFFKTIDYSGDTGGTITLRDSEISNNKCDYLLDSEDNVTFVNCTMKDNTWIRSK